MNKEVEYVEIIIEIANVHTNYCIILRQGSYTGPLLENVNIKSEMRSFKSNENIHKKEGGSYYVVSANKASSVTL